MIVCPMGSTAPAPRPCNARNTISDTIDQAKPQRIEATRKIEMPSIIIGLRPTWSANLP